MNRNDLFWQQILLGAGTGAAECTGLFCAFGIANLATGGVLAVPLGLEQLAACTLPFTQPAVFWLLYGYKLPDLVRVPLDAPAALPAAPLAVPPAAVVPVAPPAPADPPPPPEAKPAPHPVRF